MEKNKLNRYQIAFALIMASCAGAPLGIIAGIVYQTRLTGITGGIKSLSVTLFGIGIGCLINALMLFYFKKKLIK